MNVQLRKGKPIIFPYGATVEKTKRELIIKDSSGGEIGCFDRAEVVGYWKDNIPVTREDMKSEFLEEFFTENKHLLEAQSGEGEESADK